MSNTIIEGDFSASSGRYALIVSRWNSFVVESLKSGALDTLRRHGISDDNITLYYAPGAFEFPLLAQKIAAKGEFDAIIALGAVIRGGTPQDRKSTRLNSSHVRISYAVFCLKKKI